MYKYQVNYISTYLGYLFHFVQFDILLTIFCSQDDEGLLHRPSVLSHLADLLAQCSDLRLDLTQLGLVFRLQAAAKLVC